MKNSLCFGWSCDSVSSHDVFMRLTHWDESFKCASRSPACRAARRGASLHTYIPDLPPPSTTLWLVCLLISFPNPTTGLFGASEHGSTEDIRDSASCILVGWTTARGLSPAGPEPGRSRAGAGPEPGRSLLQQTHCKMKATQQETKMERQTLHKRGFRAEHSMCLASHQGQC